MILSGTIKELTQRLGAAADELLAQSDAALEQERKREAHDAGAPLTHAQHVAHSHRLFATEPVWGDMQFVRRIRVHELRQCLCPSCRLHCAALDNPCQTVASPGAPGLQVHLSE